jgi:hypothetical protein
MWRIMGSDEVARNAADGEKLREIRNGKLGAWIIESIQRPWSVSSPFPCSDGNSDSQEWPKQFLLRLADVHQTAQGQIDAMLSAASLHFKIRQEYPGTVQ